MQSLAQLGGLLFLLTFIHFIVDWGFQSHIEAMQKASNWKVRARHCTVYTGGFVIPLFYMLDPQGILVSLGLLWISHFLIDTYVPVYFWAKYLRRPPEMQDPISELEGFKAFAKQPLGLLLVVSMDQAWHVAFLLLVAFLVTYPNSFVAFCLISVSSLLGLTSLVYLGSRRLRN